MSDFLLSSLGLFFLTSFSFAQNQIVEEGTKEETIMVYDNANEMDFKLKIEGSLTDAIEATKIQDNKFLIVYNDSDNKSAQADFDTFIKNQEEAVLTYFSEHKAQYNGFNYYLATEKDKTWLKKNKITDSPCIIILGQNGEVLATAKSTLADKAYILSRYGYLVHKLKEISDKENFTRIITNKNSSDAELVKAFDDFFVLEHWGVDEYYPRIIKEADEGKFEFVKFNLDKKQVQQAWYKLILAHQNDEKPNWTLVDIILREIKGFGFNQALFKEQKVLNDTDLKSIDYLIKHYERGSISSGISVALQQNASLDHGEIEEKSDQKKVIELYKKLISIEKKNFNFYRNYFCLLEENTKNEDIDNTYLKEFDAYFNKTLGTHDNAILRLEEMYKNEFDSYSVYKFDWITFKWMHSYFCNNAARYTALNSKDATYIKKAIKWSEYSLYVTNDIPYYLDTLAQLYYKDGQKQKAIETQTLAVKYLTAEVEEETAIEIKETLSKMQNGTY